MVGTEPRCRGCDGCRGCIGTKHCVRAPEGDPIDTWFQKMLEADGILLGSPTEYATVSVEMLALMDRCALMAKFNGDLFRYKVTTHGQRYMKASQPSACREEEESLACDVDTLRR